MARLMLARNEGEAPGSLEPPNKKEKGEGRDKAVTRSEIHYLFSHNVIAVMDNTTTIRNIFGLRIHIISTELQGVKVKAIKTLAMQISKFTKKNKSDIKNIFIFCKEFSVRLESDKKYDKKRKTIQKSEKKPFNSMSRHWDERGNCRMTPLRADLVRLD
ncbi:unnamed protein product [Nesidiocoris tenuis]|uniref:Uncharacterized protein n=1 Tax=Nesidiocoris tenuis TaxID=355587 RepID=A0A6H5HGB0_9HEMI|nr:unnamed protein product [Nesidiocoris tenuis]CAB0016458.1 unnamed protein product [Nesidiocoris tenuis]